MVRFALYDYGRGCSWSGRAARFRDRKAGQEPAWTDLDLHGNQHQYPTHPTPRRNSLSHLASLRSALFLFLAGSALLVSPRAFAQEQSQLALMPLPAHVSEGPGQFLIDGSFAVMVHDYPDTRVLEGRRRFLNTLGRETGISFAVDVPTDKGAFVISTAAPSEAVEQLGEDEWYHLAVSADHVELSAKNPLGILHGLQTFLQ